MKIVTYNNIIFVLQYHNEALMQKIFSIKKNIYILIKLKIGFIFCKEKNPYFWWFRVEI